MLGQLHVQIVILACVAGRRRGGKETPATQANRYLTFDQTYGPYALGEFLFILQKYLSSVPLYKCERHFSSYQNFVKPYQTTKAPESYHGEGQIFVKRQNCQILQPAGVNLT